MGFENETVVWATTQHSSWPVKDHLNDVAQALKSELTLEPQQQEGRDCGVNLTGLIAC